jgi:hypothetical protein
MNRGMLIQQLININQNYCLSSWQAKELSMLLTSDQDRYNFLNQAFPKITDPQDFFVAMDAFRSFSVAIRLYHTTLGQMNIISTSFPSQPVNPSFPSQPVNPNFPSQPVNPNIPLNCQVVGEAELLQFIGTSKNLSFDSDKVKAIETFFSERCLQVNQITRLLELSSFESSKLDLAKKLYPKCLDKNNYFHVVNSFKLSSNKTNLMNFINGQ